MNKRKAGGIDDIPACGHKGMPMVIDGLRLECCNGRVPTCKIDTLRRIVPEYNEYKMIAKSQKIKIRMLEKQLAEANAEIKTLKDNPVTTINNTTNNTINNTVVVADGSIFNQNAYKILDLASRGENIFDVAYRSLLFISPNPNRDKLIDLYDSKDPVDQLAFRREVVENLDNGVAQIQNLKQQKDIANKLEILNDKIDEEYEKILATPDAID